MITRLADASGTEAAFTMMAASAHPFQKLICVPQTFKRPSILLAAAGSSILTFSLPEGEILNRAPPFDDDEASDDYEGVDGPSPLKRRKLEHASLSREASEDSIEIVAERRKGERRKPKLEVSKLPKVSHLLATSDGRMVITVSVEDKSVNAFSLQNSGKLIWRSTR